MKITNKKFRLKRAMWTLITGLFLAIPFLVNPDTVPFSICGFKNLTGLKTNLTHPQQQLFRFFQPD